MSIQYVRAKDLLEAELGAEIVALDAHGGQCFGFNEVAADVWRLLDRPRDLQSLQRLLMEQYDVEPDQCASDLRSCLEELESHGLVRAMRDGSRGKDPSTC